MIFSLLQFADWLFINIWEALTLFLFSQDIVRHIAITDYCKVKYNLLKTLVGD
jgi:hypothetical protein